MQQIHLLDMEFICIYGYKTLLLVRYCVFQISFRNREGIPL